MLGGIDELDGPAIDVDEGLDAIGSIIEVSEEWFGGTGFAVSRL